MIDPHLLKIPIHVWDTTLYVFVGGEKEGLDKRIKKELTGYGAHDIDTTRTDGHYQKLENEETGHLQHILWIEQQKRGPEYIGLIAHEALHATVGILDHAGVQLCDESEEAYSYLLDYIVECVYKGLDENKLWKK